MKDGHCDPFMILQCIERWCPRSVMCPISCYLNSEVEVLSNEQSQSSNWQQWGWRTDESERASKIRLARARGEWHWGETELLEWSSTGKYMSCDVKRIDNRQLSWVRSLRPWASASLSPFPFHSSYQMAPHQLHSPYSTSLLDLSSLPLLLSSSLSFEGQWEDLPCQ